MDDNVKLEDTIEVSLSTTSDPSCSLSYSNEVKKEWFCAGFNTGLKQEDLSIQRSDHKTKFEANDTNFDITSASDDIYVKLEPLESEELQIKDEIDPRSTNETTKQNSTQFEYFYCALCSSKFTSKDGLRQHMKIHTGEKPFKCSKCDYRFMKKRDLSTHVKTHNTEDKPFKCGICEIRYLRKFNLSRHMMSHTGEKPFKCGECDYSSIRKYNVLIHMKSHAQEELH